MIVIAGHFTANVFQWPSSAQKRASASKLREILATELSLYEPTTIWKSLKTASKSP